MDTSFFEYDGSRLPNEGRQIFGSTYEEFPAPKNRAKVGTHVLLKQFRSARRYPALVLDVFPGGRMTYADGEVAESNDRYHLRMDDSMGNCICMHLPIQRHEFIVVRNGRQTG